MADLKISQLNAAAAALTVWDRTWPLVASAGAALGLSDAQMDELFALADTL
jgi:hypothetical protein